MELSNADLWTLGAQHYLNDQLVDFWLQDVVSRLPPEQHNEVHVFPTFFYTRLNETRPDDGEGNTKAEKIHNKVRKWTKNVDIFDKKYLVFPINEG